MFNLNSILMWYFCGYLRTHLKGTHFGLPVLKLPTESNQETFCPLASTLLLCKNLFFLWSILCHSFHIFCFVLVISLCKMALDDSLEVLYRVSKSRNAEWCFTEKTYTFNPGIFKQKHTKCKLIY